MSEDIQNVRNRLDETEEDNLHIQFICDTDADSDYKRTHTHYEIDPESDTNVEVSKNPPGNK